MLIIGGMLSSSTGKVAILVGLYVSHFVANTHVEVSGSSRQERHDIPRLPSRLHQVLVLCHPARGVLHAAFMSTWYTELQTRRGFASMQLLTIAVCGR
jgi:hypothetical protein